MNKKKLQLEQLDRKFKKINVVKMVTPPPTGWLKAIRVSLGMSLQQLAEKLSITKQSVQEIETREKEGSITIKSLKDVANAMDMQLVYALVPKDGTLEALIERKAKKMAIDIVSRTSNNMKLEDQENTTERLKKAVEERTVIIKNEMPKTLWD